MSKFCSKCQKENPDSAKYCLNCANDLNNIAENSANGANDSGTGANAKLPEELKGVNFGAFFLAVLWSVFNKYYLGLLSLIPFFGFFYTIAMLVKGNEWAWQNRKFRSVEEFKSVQKAWTVWGFVFFILSIIFLVIFLIMRY